MIEALAEYDLDIHNSLNIIDGRLRETPLHTFGLRKPKNDWYWTLEWSNSDEVPTLEPLLRLGANACHFSEDGSKSLHHWLERNYLSNSCLKLLMDSGADSSVIRNNGKTAIHFLNPDSLTHTAILDSTLRILCPTPTSIQPDTHGNFPIHELCRSLNRTHSSLFQAFIAHGTDPMLKNGQGK